MAKRKKNASNQSGGTWEEDTEEGVDLSTAAEMWSEDELREMMREEALKLLLAQGQQTQQGITGITTNPPFSPPFTATPSYPQWTQGINSPDNYGSSNHLYDGHTTVNCNSGTLVGASS